MSKNYSDCDIVLELLPLYIEQKTGEESNSFVESHLAKCQQCREIHEVMNADFSMGIKSAEADGKTKETELKATKRRQAKQGKAKYKQKSRRLVRTAIKISILVAALMGYLGLMVGIVVYTFRYLAGV